MMSDFIYKVEKLVPIINGPFRMFSIGADLDYKFALKARSTEMPKGFQERFNEIGNNITDKFFDAKRFGREIPYHFAKESWLLQYCTVPGNACDFGLEHGAQYNFLDNFERIREQNPLVGFPISYSPHNVDTKDQALCLLDLWLEWANLTKSFFIDSP
jgi:hypothetical protein